MVPLDPDIRLTALEAVATRLLLAEARRQPDPAGMLDAFAAQMRRHAETAPLPGEETDARRMALAAALLQLVAEAKERLIAEQWAPG